VHIMWTALAALTLPRRVSNWRIVKTEAEPIDSAYCNPLFSSSNSDATLDAHPLVAQVTVITASTFLLLDGLFLDLRLRCFFTQDTT